MSEIIRINLLGYDIDEMLEKYIKGKLGRDITINYTEFCTGKIKNKHILNDDENEFDLFIEYQRRIDEE